jgi:F-type H+-transporting ATPase subunit epsilon
MPDERRKFDVSIVTPEGSAFEGEAELLIVPGAAGEIGVLARHAPLVATLKAGAMHVHVAGDKIEDFATGPGFFTVQFDRAIAVVDNAVKAEEIDPAAAQRALEEARGELEKIEAGESTADRWMVEQRIIHYETQLEVATGGNIRDIRPKVTAGEHHV